jgi:hypothetical protein
LALAASCGAWLRVAAVRCGLYKTGSKTPKLTNRVFEFCLKEPGVSELSGAPKRSNHGYDHGADSDD